MRNIYDSSVEGALRELSDIDEQRRLWLSTGNAEVSSLTECISRLWDDSGLGDALDSGETVYSIEIDRMFDELWNRLRVMDDRAAPVEIINDPRFIEVRNRAQEILIALREFGYDRAK